jgi:CMP-N-acetylneuraminate monooxygenase
VSFEIRDGRLTVLPSPPEQANLTIAMPLTVLTAVIREDLSWDEAFIGYWCEFHRHPDVYHAGFWRLFQAPYFKKPISITHATDSTEVSSASTIAEVLEAHGATADRLLRRYGLYCLGCQHAVSDSIALGARHHGIDEQRVSRLIQDLNSAIAAGPVTDDDSASEARRLVPPD